MPLWRTFQETPSLVSTVTQFAQSGTCVIYQACRGFFSFRLTDGSNNSLKICSAGGGVDVYVGDGGSADIQTQEGEFTACGLVKHTGSVSVFDVCCSHSLSHSGDVCVRVPASLIAGVELRGASVHIDSEVVMHRTERKPAENPTTVMGKLPIFPFCITVCTSIIKLNSQHKRSFLSGYINGVSAVDQWVKVQTDRGSVRLRTQSWFETLKLGGHE